MLPKTTRRASKPQGLPALAPPRSAPADSAWPEGADYLSTYRGLQDDMLRGYRQPRIDISEDPTIGMPGTAKPGVAGFYNGIRDTAYGAPAIHMSQGYNRGLPIRDAQGVLEHEVSHAVDMMSPDFKPGGGIKKGQAFDDPSQGPLHPDTHRFIMNDVMSQPFASRYRVEFPDTKKVRATYGKNVDLGGYIPRVYVNVGGGKDVGANIPLTLADFADYKAHAGTFAPRAPEKAAPRSKGGARAAL